MIILKRVFLSMIVLSLSCSVPNKLFFVQGAGVGRKEYYIEIPSGSFKRFKSIDDSRFVTKWVKYDCGSIIYLTDDYLHGGGNLDLKIKKYGNGIFLHYPDTDSLNIFGRDEDNYWREIKNRSIIYGYYNVPENRVEEFEKALHSFSSKKPGLFRRIFGIFVKY